MKHVLTILVVSSFLIQGLSAQLVPASVCTSLEAYSFDEEVTWYFDLTGNSALSPGENLYFWSWQPVSLPWGRELLNYEGDLVWSLTFIPTNLYGAPLAEIQAAGDGALWCSLQNEAGEA